MAKKRPKKKTTAKGLPSLAGKTRAGRAKQVEMEQRRITVAKLYTQAIPIAAIALQLGTSRETIDRDLAAIRLEWREHRLKEYGDLKELELQKIDRSESEAWDAWQNSKKSTRHRKRRTGPDGTVLETQYTSNAGNPRFLEIVLRCVERRAKILGLDAPEQHVHEIREVVQEVIVSDREQIPRVLDFGKLSGSN